MNIFDHLNDIVFSKKRKFLENTDNESEYVPFMINRWISMISPRHAEVVNSTANWLHPVLLDDKRVYYKLLHNVVARHKWMRVNYIKKVKSDTDDESAERLVRLAKKLELSVSEVTQLSQMNDVMK